jgi:hypothetical protein
VDAISEAVEDLRGLDQTKDVEPEFVGRAELERRLRDLADRR